jgi:hypothetical protein
MSGESETLDVGETPGESPSATREVCCATLEVERARDATHSAVALNRAETAGETETRNGCQEVLHVLAYIRSQPLEDRALRLGQASTAARRRHGGLTAPR